MIKEKRQYNRKSGFVRKIVNLLNEKYEPYFTKDLCKYLAIQSLEIDDEEKKYIEKAWLGSYNVFRDLYKYNFTNKEITPLLKRFKKLVRYIDYDEQKNTLSFNFDFLDKTHISLKKEVVDAYFDKFWDEHNLTEEKLINAALKVRYGKQ